MHFILQLSNGVKKTFDIPDAEWSLTKIKDIIANDPDFIADKAAMGEIDVDFVLNGKKIKPDDDSLPKEGNVIISYVSKAFPEEIQIQRLLQIDIYKKKTKHQYDVTFDEPKYNYGTDKIITTKRLNGTNTLQDLLEFIRIFYFEPRSYYKDKENNVESFNVSNTEYQLCFNGKVYAKNTPLSKIHDDMNFNIPLTFEKTEAMRKLDLAMDARDQLNQSNLFKDKPWEALESSLYCNHMYNDKVYTESFIKREINEIKKKIPEQLINVVHINYKEIATGKWKVALSITDLEVIKKIAQGDLNALAISIAAPIIAQDRRKNPSDPFSIGAMSGDVLSRIGDYLSPENTGQRLGDRVDEENKKSFERATFGTISPIEANGVRQSIGATACLIVRSGMITESQARKGENIASIDCNDNMTLKFINNDYGTQFFHALQNAGYQHVSFKEINEKNTYGHYTYSVTISNWNEVKRFIEKTCGYSSDYTIDLLNTMNVKLSPDFFIKELASIGQSSDSLREKKDKAKEFMDKFLPVLDMKKVQSLKEEIANKSQESYEGPDSIKFTREKTGITSLFKNYGSTDTFDYFFKAIDREANKPKNTLSLGNST